MLRVGITGGIGSGKSTVCRVFETLGVHVYHADEEARALYTGSPELKRDIIAAFGEDTYLSDGNINRDKMRLLAFSNPETASRLNGIVHPYVFGHYETWCAEYAADSYTLKEAAIMFESGSYKRLHVVIGVAAPAELRISRTMQRDGISREAVLERMGRQWPQEEVMSRCRFVIMNDGEHNLISQVMEIHHQLLRLSENELPFLG